MEIKGKNIFITGSTRGIGLAMAHQFASLGANIVLMVALLSLRSLLLVLLTTALQLLPSLGMFQKHQKLNVWSMKLSKV